MPGDSAAPYCRSVTMARARLRSRFTTTISRASPLQTADRRLAEPTAPAPITPIFRRPSSIWISKRLSGHDRLLLFSEGVQRAPVDSQVRLDQFGRRQRDPLVERYVGVVAALEHLEEAQLVRAWIFAEVAH